MADGSYLGWPFFEERHRRLARELGAFQIPAPADSVAATCRTLVRSLGKESR